MAEKSSLCQKSDRKKNHPCEIDLLTFPRFISYARCDWLLPYSRCSDVMNTTSHRVYQTVEGERGSEVAANDLGRLRIRLTRPNMKFFLEPRDHHDLLLELSACGFAIILYLLVIRIFVL